MKALRPVLMIGGLLAAALGLLWIGQGLGYVRWPESSFMIAQRPWVVRGSIVAAAGLLAVLLARRLPRR